MLHIRCKMQMKMKMQNDENAKRRSDFKWNYAIKFYACANRFMWNNMVFSINCRKLHVSSFVWIADTVCVAYVVQNIEKVKTIFKFEQFETFLHWNLSISLTCWWCFKNISFLRHIFSYVRSLFVIVLGL